MLGITVAELHELDYNEYMGWQEYFSRRPVGWREDLRAYYIMSSMAGSKKGPEEIFPSIATLKQERNVSDVSDQRQLKSLEASPFGTMLSQHNIEIKS